MCVCVCVCVCVSDFVHAEALAEASIRKFGFRCAWIRCVLMWLRCRSLCFQGAGRVCKTCLRPDKDAHYPLPRLEQEFRRPEAPNHAARSSQRKRTLNSSGLELELNCVEVAP